MNINEFINNIKNKFSDYKRRSINEAQTKEWLIRPFFQTLHWNFSNDDEVIPEDDDLSGKRPDYGFYFKNEKAKFFVEAKSINTNIDDKKIITEKLNYCHNANVPFLIITNGIEYAIYYTELKGANEDKLLRRFSLNDEIDYEIINKLYREAFENDTLETYAKNLAVSTNVKRVIEKLFQIPTKKFLDIINDEIKAIYGHNFGNDDIRNALKRFNFEINNEVSTPIQTSNSRVRSPNLTQLKSMPVGSSMDGISHRTGSPAVEKEEQHTHDDSKWTIEHQFNKGKWRNSFELYNKLKRYLETNGFVFVEKPTKFYIGLLYNDKNYIQVHGQKSRLKLWLTIGFDELSEQEKLNSRDVSTTGHWGMGDVEYTIRTEADFDGLLSIIRKIFGNTK